LRPTPRCLLEEEFVLLDRDLLRGHARTIAGEAAEGKGKRPCLRRERGCRRARLVH